MISDIAYHHIAGEYSLANYLGFKVVMLKCNGYINATKLCIDGGGNQLQHWRENASSKRLILVLEKQIAEEAPVNMQTVSNTLQNGNVGIPTLQSNSIIKIVTASERVDDRLIRGSYYHPDLMPHVACWISEVYALKVSKIVNHYIVQEYKTQLQASTSLLQLLLRQLPAGKHAIYCGCYTAGAAVTTAGTGRSTTGRRTTAAGSGEGSGYCSANRGPHSQAD